MDIYFAYNSWKMRLFESQSPWMILDLFLFFYFRFCFVISLSAVFFTQPHLDRLSGLYKLQVCTSANAR